MRIALALLALPALAACQTGRAPYSPIDNVAYSALGHDPFWLLTIGDERIILTLGDEGGRADGALASYAYPRVLARHEGEFRTWESADGNAVIAVQARPGPCRGSGGRTFEDQVRVRLSGRELSGCGGRMIDPDAG